MAPPNWIEVGSLTTYEVAPDGFSVKLNVRDADGRDASLIVPLEHLRALALSMPKIVFDATRFASGGDDSLRLTHSVEHWKIERSTDAAHAILTLMTPDRFEISFAIKEQTIAQMAELMAEFRLEAFPEGLHFH